MRFGRYQFCNIILNEGSLPGFSGSALRGAFGHALRAVTCSIKEGECETCLKSDGCLYAKVFELKPHNYADAKSLVAAPPHPYVIEPPPPTERSFVAGDAFTFDLLLFGDANNFLSDFISAAELMGSIGARTSRDSIRFALSEVVAGDQTIYRKSNGTLLKDDWSRPLLIELPEETVPGRLDVRLMTPLRLKVDGRYTDRLPIQTFVRALMRRATILFNAYGKGGLPFDHRYLLELAKGIEVIYEKLQWQDFSRNSSRQRNRMALGGIVGNISYQGQFGPFLPLLEFCKETHLGKQTTFGLGKFDYKWQEDLA